VQYYFSFVSLYSIGKITVSSAVKVVARWHLKQNMKV
jgi:hypothetical protein